MDSGNSGSMQSSSTGGDEEYDSRTESISPLLNPSAHFGSISNQQLSHHHPSTLLDSPSQYNLAAFSQSPANSLYNLDLVWPRGLRSDPNYTDLGNITGLSSSSTQSLLGAPTPSQGMFPSSSSMPLRSVDGNGGRATPPQAVVKNSKKRTRASRRAPTTVLTTDTSNFRQMVQEFTGIPAAPFSASPYSRRLDLFGSGSAMRSGHLEPLYPLRPSVQKAQPSPPFVSSSSFNIASTSLNSNNYQLPSSDHLGLLPKQPQNMQNPILPFQSLLQSPSFKYPLPAFGSKSQSLDDQLGHVTTANLGVFPNHGSTTEARRDNNVITRWRDEEASGRQVQLGSFDGNNGINSQQHVGGYKLNCSASTPDFHTDKGLENVSTSRGEGTVDSWNVCPNTD
uniref:VQ domain-containing protein n=1 Tax=Davidia involucrata TaxID=16924 RepID=A0A5B6YS58_DAVIN